MGGSEASAGRRPRAILIAGPTASGKSALAIRLAQRLGGVIVNCDSMQVYADLRIITARPSEAEERLVHRDQELETVTEISNALGRARDNVEVARPVVRAVTSLLGVGFAGVVLIDATLLRSPPMVGSIATSALILSGRASSALKPNAPDWLCTSNTHGQILSTSSR